MPSPWIMRSVLRPVVSAEPCPKLVLMAPTWTPRPTWTGFVPPRPLPAAAAAVSIWLRVSWKTVVLALKPIVLALAMLLPVTSSMVWLTRRPLMPAKSERSMVEFPLGGWVTARRPLVLSGGGAVGDGLDLGQGHLVVADVEHR